MTPVILSLESNNLLVYPLKLMSSSTGNSTSIRQENLNSQVCIADTDNE